MSSKGKRKKLHEHGAPVYNLIRRDIKSIETK